MNRAGLTYRGKRFRFSPQGPAEAAIGQALLCFLRNHVDVSSTLFPLSVFEQIWMAATITLRHHRIGANESTLYRHQIRSWHSRRYLIADIPGHNYFFEVFALYVAKLKVPADATAAAVKAILDNRPTFLLKECVYRAASYFCILKPTMEDFFTECYGALIATHCFQESVYSEEEFAAFWSDLQKICAQELSDSFAFVRDFAGVSWTRRLPVQSLLRATELLHFLQHRPQPASRATFLMQFDACLPYPAADWAHFSRTPAERSAMLAQAVQSTAPEPALFASDVEQCRLQQSEQNAYACPCCSTTCAHANDLLAHLQSHHFNDPACRVATLKFAKHCWPSEVSSDLIREHLVRAHQTFSASVRRPPTCCGICATASEATSFTLLDFRAKPKLLPIYDDFFSASKYVARCRAQYPDELPKGFAGITFCDLATHTVPRPTEIPNAEAATCQSFSVFSHRIVSVFQFELLLCFLSTLFSLIGTFLSYSHLVPFNVFGKDRWILFSADSTLRTQWERDAADPSASLTIQMCPECAVALTKSKPTLPALALANDTLSLPPPPELQDLSLGEQLFIARGFALRRLRSLTTTNDPLSRQKGIIGTASAIAFPQDPTTVLHALPSTAEHIADYISVFFTTEDCRDLRFAPEYVVRRARVQDALLWLIRHNPFYMDLVLDFAAIAELPEEGIPLAWLSLPQRSDTVLEREYGPADAHTESSTHNIDASSLHGAVLDLSEDPTDPARLWTTALTACERFQSHQDQHVAAHEDIRLAQFALQALAQQAEHRSFSQDSQFELHRPTMPCPTTTTPSTSSTPSKLYAYLPHADAPLDSYHASFWTFCFPCLFPWGQNLDGIPRRTFLSDHSWGRHLLRRRDRNASTHWRCDQDFIAVLFSVLHRRRLLRAVRARLHSPTFQRTIPHFCNLQAIDFAHVASTIGECLPLYF